MSGGVWSLVLIQSSRPKESLDNQSIVKAFLFLCRFPGFGAGLGGSVENVVAIAFWSLLLANC